MTKPLFKSYFFLTKVLPFALFVMATVIVLYPYTVFKTVFGITILFFALLNMILKKEWMSCTLGALYSMLCIYFLINSITEYRELATTNKDYEQFMAVVSLREGLLVMIMWLGWSISGILMGVLLFLPFRRKHSETSFNSIDNMKEY